MMQCNTYLNKKIKKNCKFQHIKTSLSEQNMFTFQHIKSHFSKEMICTFQHIKKVFSRQQSCHSNTLKNYLIKQNSTFQQIPTQKRRVAHSSKELFLVALGLGGSDTH